MKNFNYYKNKIEDHCEESRLAIFEFIEFIDFKDLDSIVDSVLKQKDWITIHSVLDNVISLKLKYYENEYFLTYYLKSDKIVVANETSLNNIQISLIVKTKLLNYIQCNEGKITFNQKPKVYSVELQNDINKFIECEYSGFDCILTYDPNIDIDETIRSHSFLFDYKQNLALDLKGTYKFGDLRIKKLNLFNISKVDKNIIEEKKPLFERYYDAKNAEELQFFFESIFVHFIQDQTLNSMIEEEGLHILGNEDFKNLLELNLSF